MKDIKKYNNYKEIMKFMPKGRGEKEINEALESLIAMGFMQIDVDKNELIVTKKGDKAVRGMLK